MDSPAAGAYGPSVGGLGTALELKLVDGQLNLLNNAFMELWE